MRVRTEDLAARIEMDHELIISFITSNFYKEAAAFMKSIGFRTISLDLEGYRTGSFNSTLEKKTV